MRRVLHMLEPLTARWFLFVVLAGVSPGIGWGVSSWLNDAIWPAMVGLVLSVASWGILGVSILGLGLGYRRLFDWLSGDWL